MGCLPHVRFSPGSDRIADIAERQFRAISGCSGVWVPPPKYRNNEACNQESYLDAD
jgi:hypothetical protein